MTLIVSRRSLLALTAGSALAAVARAADPKPAGPDTEFLEYLGSSDDVEPDLQQYLAKPDETDKEDSKPAPKRGSGRT